jgi:hypothetical protein
VAAVQEAAVPQVAQAELAEQQVEQVQVETEGLQIVVAPEIVVLHPPIPLLVVMHQ